MIEKPYFLDNEKWYELTDDGYILTTEGEAITEVKESYEEFVKDLNEYK